jgi:superfamily II DNA helicase RecQ
MLMVIPSLLEKDSITIGIVPLNSLLLDYSRKLKAQGTPFQIFQSHDSPTLLGNQNLVLTTVDQARTKSWKQQIGELNQRIPIARVVFDEGHYAITDNDFRGVLDDVHELRQFAVQLVVLSATIPPKSEATIREAFGLMQDTLVVRTATCRPELQYIIEEPLRGNSDIADRVEALIQDARLSLKKEDRILVFVPFIDNGVNLAKQLDCDFFRGGRGTSSQDKEDMYQNWVEGVNQVMVCTNAFGAGNDYSHVPLVIHAGTPRHMMMFIQESSRAGRNKKPSKCIILPRKAGGQPKCKDEIDHKGERDMYDMLFGNRKDDCINHALSLFNDGTGVRCFNSWNGQRCSRCIGFKATPHPTGILSRGQHAYQ